MTPTFSLPSGMLDTPAKRLAFSTGLLVWVLLLAGMLGVILTAPLAPVALPSRDAGLSGMSDFARDTLTEADRQIDFSRISVTQVVEPLPYLPRLLAPDATQPATFAERWDALDETKPYAASQEPPEIKIAPRPPQAKPAAIQRPTQVAEVVQDEEEPRFRRQMRKSRGGGDVCSRHGLRRVETRGGRSWRCRR